MFNKFKSWRYLSFKMQKNRRADDAIKMALEDARSFGNLSILLKIKNAVSKFMKNLGYNKDYQIYDKDDYLVEKLKWKKYFRED